MHGNKYFMRFVPLFPNADMLFTLDQPPLAFQKLEQRDILSQFGSKTDVTAWQTYRVRAWLSRGHLIFPLAFPPFVQCNNVASVALELAQRSWYSVREERIIVHMRRQGVGECGVRDPSNRVKFNYI